MEGLESGKYGTDPGGWQKTVGIEQLEPNGSLESGAARSMETGYRGRKAGRNMER